MDNHYVPSLTIGPMVCEALVKYGIKAPIDVHLMVRPVDRIIGDFIEAGASYITFHPEGSDHIDRSLQLIRSGGCKSGLVFNPFYTAFVSRLCHGQSRYDSADVCKPGFWRAEVHSFCARKASPSPAAN